jgi:hypothetical protein
MHGRRDKVFCSGHCRFAHWTEAQRALRHQESERTTQMAQELAELKSQLRSRNT